MNPLFVGYLIAAPVITFAIGESVTLGTCIPGPSAECTAAAQRTTIATAAVAAVSLGTLIWAYHAQKPIPVQPNRGRLRR